MNKKTARPSQMLRLSPASMAPPPHYRPRISYIPQGSENSYVGGGWERSPGKVNQTKWLVLRIIHGSRIPGSYQMGKRLVDLDGLPG